MMYKNVKNDKINKIVKDKMMFKNSLKNNFC